MNFQDFEVDPTDPKYISGIYNYCDRWCERCPFTGRCSVFAMEQEMEDEAAQAGERDNDNAAFWQHLEQVFAETKIVINNIPPDPEDMEDGEDEAIEDDPDFDLYMAQQEAREEEIDKHPLSAASYTYAMRVRDWFEEHGPLFPDDTDPQLGSSARELADAASIAQWYEFQIHVKLRRALDRDDEMEEHLAAKGFPKDSDGSAKVALIGMDRSIAAWTRIQVHLPRHADQAADFIVRLEQLRRQTERDFPNARAFVRPGFDTDQPR